jgi:hypothetical protein
MNNTLSFFERVRIVFISLLFLGTRRSPTFKCFDFVKYVFRAARIREHDSFVNIDPGHRNHPPAGTVIFLLEKGVRRKKWSHVGIALPFGYMIHMSYYWGKKVTITSLREIWNRYELAG